MSRRKLNNRRVQLLLPPHLVELVDQASRMRGHDRSAAVAEALRAWLLAVGAELSAMEPKKRRPKKVSASP